MSLRAVRDTSVQEGRPRRQQVHVHQARTLFAPIWGRPIYAKLAGGATLALPELEVQVHPFFLVLKDITALEPQFLKMGSKRSSRRTLGKSHRAAFSSNVPLVAILPHLTSLTLSSALPAQEDRIALVVERFQRGFAAPVTTVRSPALSQPRFLALLEAIRATVVELRKVTARLV